MVEAAIVLVAVALAAAIVFARLGREAGLWRHVVAVGMLAFAAAGLLRPRAAARPEGGPKDTERGAFVSSSACRSCHPSEHATWRASFHSRMTQRADRTTVLAPLDRTLDLDGRSFELSVRGDAIWAKMPDLDALADAEGADAGRVTASVVERPILLTTGSHNYQGYWVAGRRPGELRMLPFVYVLAERAWLTRRDVFLQPEGTPQHFVRWNSNCVQCHAVGGRPRRDARDDRFDTEAVELGIACEACHGPGGEHARAHRSPTERYAAHASRGVDATIVNPARLPADRASAVCGQCHSYAFPRDESDWWQSGYTRSFRAGDALDPSRELITYRPADDTSPRLDTALESIFWRDGTVRVGGREYNGMILSKCFVGGEGERKIACTSCHSMHDSDPNDQLVRGREGDEACLRCHEALRAKIAQHTRHRAGSSGARCTSCHMPKTTYALLKSIASHRIDSPSARAAADTGRPAACNLCHLDKSLGWTRDELAAGWGAPRPALDEREEREPAIVAALLRGDAAQRVIAAAAMGDAEALAVSGNGWQVPLLAQLLVDPYAAVRIVAMRALRAQPGFADLDVGSLATPEARARLRGAVLDRWEAGQHPARAWLPLGAGAKIDRDALARMASLRDQRAVTIAE